MPQAVVDDPPVTIAAFDVFLDAQRDDAPWELVAGCIVAMTNPTELHEQVVANIGARLKLAMDARGRRAYLGGLRVQRPDDARGVDKPRPDLLVRCGPASGRNYVTDPLVVVEVLSPSTMDIDRGDKLRFYKSLPTLRHIVLVYQDQMRVEHYSRQDTGWVRQVLTGAGDPLVLEAIGFALHLGEAYLGALPEAR